MRSSIGNFGLCKKRNSSLNKQLLQIYRHLDCINEPPFYSVGVDYFEPILIKQKRSFVKRYGCLFPRLSMRAVHIEIANFLVVH